MHSMKRLSSFERIIFKKYLTLIKKCYNKYCLLKKSSDDGKEVTPVPIPNTEVKLFSADGSWGLPPARVGRRLAYYTQED